MKILITGGNGFIGKSLIPKLIQFGNEITIIDPVSRKDHHNSVSQISVDFRDSEKMKKILSNTDVVIHLAALLGVDVCEKAATETLKANGIDACRFFDLCKENNVKHIIYTSSSEIYGDTDEATENSHSNPKSDYAVAKLYSERYLNSISTNNFTSHILRLFSVYGRNQRNDFVISKFMKLAKESQPITIFGDGSQIRAFCHINDVVNAINLCIQNIDKVDKSTLLNIGNNNEPISIKILAEKILKLNNLSADTHIVNIPLEETTRGVKREIYKRIPSIKKAKKELNYTPKVNLDKGLLEFLE